MQSNENYSPVLELSNDAKASLAAAVGRILRVEGKKDFDRRRESQH